MTKPMGHPIKKFDLHKMNVLLDKFDYTPFEEGIRETINFFNNKVKKN